MQHGPNGTHQPGQDGVGGGLFNANIGGPLGDQAALAKQMALLNAVGRTRGQTAGGLGVGVGVGGQSSGQFSGQGQHNRPAPSSVPQDMASRQQQQQQQQQLYLKQRRAQFLSGLHTIHIQRGSPLPPALTGIPNPAFDPSTSQWKPLEPGPEPGYIRFAGKDIDLLKLYQIVSTGGGTRKVLEDNRWAEVASLFELPPESANVFASIHLNLIVPFEEVLSRRSQMQQQQQAGGPQPGVPLPPVSQGQLPPGMPFAQQQQQPVPPPQIARSASLGSAVGGVPGMPSAEQHTPGAQLQPQSQPADSEQAMDHEAENRKRKLVIEEEAKRVRQKTESPASAHNASTPAIDRASAPAADGSPIQQNPSAQASASSMPPSSPSRDGPRRRRVEYLPLSREVDTDGGRNLNHILEEHRRITVASFQVQLDDFGTLEIDALTMSIRSRIGVELSYALTALTILSIMRSGTGGFPIHSCPELLDELLDLVEESAFGDEPDTPPTLDDDIVTYKQLIQTICDDGEKLFSVLEPHQGQKPPERGPLQRPADIVLTVLNVLRNLSVVPDNRDFLARHDRALPVILRLCGVRRDVATGALRAASSAFSLTDLASVRRDILYLLVNLGGAVLLAPNLVQAPNVAATRVAQRVFELVSSYVLEPGLLSPYTVVMESGGRPPPPLVDAALEVFTRFALPDVNRKVISREVPERWQRAVFAGLVHRLPLSDLDFQVIREETWLSYIERAIMAIYTLAFLAGPDLKRAYRADRALGVPRLFLRLVKKLTVNVSPNIRAYYNVCARRVVETLKVLDDAADAFEAAQASGGPPLAFGMGYADGEQDVGEKGSGLLAGFQEDVLWTVMMQKVVTDDEYMFQELDSLARVGMPIAA